MGGFAARPGRAGGIRQRPGIGTSDSKCGSVGGGRERPRAVSAQSQPLRPARQSGPLGRPPAAQAGVQRQVQPQERAVRLPGALARRPLVPQKSKLAWSHIALQTGVDPVLEDCGGEQDCTSQVEECQRNLAKEKEYYRRYRVCKVHATQSVVHTCGEDRRYCQQCSVFHAVHEFDGEKR